MTNDNSNNPPTSSENSTDNSNVELDNIVDIDKYFISSKGEIVQKLKLLMKSKSSVTGYFDSGNDFFLTSVVDVLREKNILILDIARDQELNKKVTNTDRLVFKTKHLGITAQFNATSIQTAKFKGEQYFACAIPDSLLWVQRRQFFRVQIPRSYNAIVQIKNEDGELSEYRIIDVSSGGIAVEDEFYSLKVEAGDEFVNVNLIFDDQLSTTASLSIQNTLPLDFKNSDSGQRIGCMFESLRADFSADLQRFINLVDSNYRKTSAS
jgi:c-di-GMP-binding flagellar brake protein YcgR